MSEGKKRSRKSKLEVRTEVENDVEDETGNNFLQEPPRPKIPKFLQMSTEDHNYSISRPPSIEVEIEVEELDESDLRLHCSDSEENEPVPQAVVVKNPIVASKLDAEQILNVADRIEMENQDLAHRLLNLEMKNYWGHFLSDTKGAETVNPYDKMIDDALEYWSVGGAVKFRLARDTPMFYQCHICNVAWFYLHPFREHIRNHDLDKLFVSHQGFFSNFNKSDSEVCVITATEVKVTHNYYRKFKFIPLDGHCAKCGKSADHHQDIRFPCEDCNNDFYSCFKLRKHKEHCPPRKKVFGCDICYLTFATEKEWQKHLKVSHTVRSDVPIHANLLTCEKCNGKYLKTTSSSKICPSCVRIYRLHCKLCYRKFPNPISRDSHIVSNTSDYPCRVCGRLLKSQCQEAEHILGAHSDKYCVAFTCGTLECEFRNTVVFPSREMLKLHTSCHPLKSTNKVILQCIDVMIPKQCLHFEPLYRDKKAVSDKPTRPPNLPAKSKPAVKKAIPCQQRILDEPLLNADTKSENAMSYEELLSTIMFQGSHQAPGVIIETQNKVKIKEEPLDYDEYGNISQVNIEENLHIKAEPVDFDNDYENEQISDIGIHVNEQISDMDSEVNEKTSDTSRHVNERTSDRKENEEKNDVQKSVNLLMNIKEEPIHDEEVDESKPGDILIENVTSLRENDVSRAHFDIPIDLPKEISSVFVPNIKVPPRKVTRTFTDVRVYTKTTKDTRVGSQKSYHITNEPSTSDLLQIKSEPLEMEDVFTYKMDPDLLDSLKSEADVPVKIEDKKPRRRETKPRKMYKKRTYTCSQCWFTSKHKTYKEHLVTCEGFVNKNKLFTCTKCNESYSILRMYLYHFRVHGYKDSSCPVCEEVFTGTVALVAHFRRHVINSFVKYHSILANAETTKMKRMCNICKVLVSTEDIFVHWENHFELKKQNEIKKPIPMPTYDFSGNSRVLGHGVVEMLLRDLKYCDRAKDCLLCARTFNRKQEHKRHLVEHLLTDALAKKAYNVDGELRLRCQDCDASFPTDNKYRFHMREHAGMPIYKCDICNKTFSDSSNFCKHKKLHDIKALVCDICNKKFQAKAMLERHMIMHMKVGVIPCKRCSRKFYSKSLLKKHEKNFHRLKKVEFKCRMCAQSFDSSLDKLEHDWEMHGIRRSPADCPICFEKFRKYNDLKKHAEAEHSVLMKRFQSKVNNDDDSVNYFYKLTSVNDNVVTYSEVSDPDFDPKLIERTKRPHRDGRKWIPF